MNVTNLTKTTIKIKCAGLAIYWELVWCNRISLCQMYCHLYNNWNHIPATSTDSTYKQMLHKIFKCHLNKLLDHVPMVKNETGYCLQY